MTNIHPPSSGLPLTIWVSPRGNARHGPRIKVCRRPGNRMVADETVSVSIGPHPEIKAPPGVPGLLAAEDLDQVRRWIALNRDALLLLWTGAIDGVEFGHRMRKLER